MLQKPYAEKKFNSDNGIFYKKLVTKIPDLIFQLSLSPTGDLSSPFLNKAVINYFELSRQELRNFDLSQRIVPDDFQKLLSSIQSLDKNTDFWSHEFRAILPTKGLRWFKAVANVERDIYNYISLYGRISDITEEKQRDIELKISEERFQFAMEASSNGIWDLDLRTGKVFFSPQSLRILELTQDDVIDTNEKWDERIHPDDLEKYLKDFNMHIKSETDYFENAKRMKTKSGNYKWILSSGKIIERDKNGLPTRLTGTHTDITSQKENETAILKNSQIINEQNSRLLNFAHIVSHNLSSHTGNFKMLLDLIETENDSETVLEIFEHLKTSSNALNQTIEHLKELVDINTHMVHKKENLDLNLYLNKVLGILSEEISNNKVKIFKQIPKKCNIAFNPSYLESILLNFTTNAIKYSHPDRTPEIYYSMRKEDGKCVLEIKDNGLGIDLEKHGRKLFGMYKTFHKNKNSRGIGLFITKNQIESMGGNIEVESKTNIGTTFKIFFSNEV
ncbi:PAS domain-containing sensor histidine kinase [Flavobacterium dankookense]|uniref:histidine kinase n=1 Tax=Flavobacterium dankookense TaxID=706186 RepID=A0A4R6QI79_9FLAO|nr:PAS domain-containing sensor histidine kinase [Flavobacterium dankookense]TDP61752.1 PAS domain S-box-containing protein [Flavobacterium dankookense]